MNESPLDREIRAALKVEPSPEFLVHVRARLEREPMPAAWRVDWRLVTVGAVVMAALVLSVVWLVPVRETAAPGVAIVPVAPIAPGATPSSGSGSAAQRAAAIQAASTVAVSASVPPERVARRSRDPEVLVNANEIAAFHRLLRSLSDDGVDLTALASGVPDAATPLPEVAEMSLAPLSVELLEPVTQ